MVYVPTETGHWSDYPYDLVPVTSSKGYGSRYYRETGETIGAHRYAWLMEYGNIPDDSHVLHRCDVRNCINIKHLFLGTNNDNIQDCVDKGRSSRNRGSSNPMRKLVEIDVVNILRRIEKGDRLKDIAKDFQVHPATISDIKRGLTWKEIDY